MPAFSFCVFIPPSCEPNKNPRHLKNEDYFNRTASDKRIKKVSVGFTSITEHKRNRYDDTNNEKRGHTSHKVPKGNRQPILHKVNRLTSTFYGDEPKNNKKTKFF